MYTIVIHEISMGIAKQIIFTRLPHLNTIFETLPGYKGNSYLIKELERVSRDFAK